MGANVDIGAGATCACPELITIIVAPFLKFNKFINLFTNGTGNQSTSSFDDDVGESARAMSHLHPSLSFILH